MVPDVTYGRGILFAATWLLYASVEMQRSLLESCQGSVWRIAQSSAYRGRPAVYCADVLVVSLEESHPKPPLLWEASCPPACFCYAEVTCSS